MQERDGRSAMAKLILTNEVVGLGVAGDVVDVKLGYARNYLIPQGLAVSWSQGGQKQVDQIKSARDAKALASQEEAQSLKDRLESASLVIEVKAGTAGRLFGSVTRSDIFGSIESAGIAGVDKRSIRIESPIKSTGLAECSIKVHDGMVAVVRLVIKAKR